MAEVKPTVFKVIQSYGGLKEAYFETPAATAADTINFADNNVEGAVICDLQNDGVRVNSPISGDDSNIVTIGTGPDADVLVGRILFRSY